MSNSAFKKSFRKLCERAGDRADQVVRKVALDILSNVISRSPVGNPDLWKGPAPAGYAGGTFRANWNVSLGVPDGSSTNSLDPDGQSTISRGAAIVQKYTTGQTVFITNGLPYGQRLEYDSWSSQAPSGMVRITITEYGKYLRNAVAGLK